MAMATESNKTKCYWILDAPRLRSHLFFRFLSTHPAISPIYHPFLLPAMFGPEHIAQHFQHSDARQQELDAMRVSDFAVTDTFASAHETYSQNLAGAASRHQTPLANEHWFNLLRHDLVVDIVRGKITSASQLPANPTLLSDDAFASLVPIILIRHPVLLVNSVYRDALQLTQQRPGDEDFTIIASIRWARILYDFFLERRDGVPPLVVNGEHVLWQTEEVKAAVGRYMGLDGHGFQEHWEPAAPEVVEKMHPILYQFTKKVHESRGIDREGLQPGEPDLSLQVSKWTELYGETISKQLEAYVLDTMPDYRYVQGFAVGAQE